EPEQPGTHIRGSFLHVQDPALYAAADPAMVRRPGRHWVFLRHLAGSSVPWFILKSGGRELEFLSAASQAVAATPLPEPAVGAAQALGGRGAADSAGLGIGSLESGAAGGKSPRENADEGDLRQAAELICAFFRKRVFYAQGSNRP